MTTDEAVIGHSERSFTTAPQLAHPKYRPDIDGLRAIAVLSVVAYHAFPARMRGGFIGVDVFFVISGFLISSIIFANLEKSTFSLAEFYSRRIRRIFPALLCVLTAGYVFGFFALFADEYEHLGKHIAGGAGFISNFLLWHESGYFESAAETKPFLHLWSLGIEEQFYIFWPLLLAFVWRRNWNFLAITALVGAISFTINVYWISSTPIASFYSPLARFWELMIGGVLAYITLHQPKLNAAYKNVQSAAGLALLILGFATISIERNFPGWWALLPTTGSFLLISAGPTALINRRLLSSRPLVWVGLISYPLYLWHWPILVFMRIVNGDEPAREARVIAVIASVVLAWLTYSYVERPFRRGKRVSGKVLGLCVSMLIIGCLGYQCYASGGLRGYGIRQAERQEYIAFFDNSSPELRYFRRMGMDEKYRLDCNFYDTERSRAGRPSNIPRPGIGKTCFERDPSYRQAVLIWGDSHAEQLYYGLSKNLPKDWQILQVASASCAPRVDVTGPSRTDVCDQSNWFALRTVQVAKPDVVIVAQRDGHNAADFVHIGEKLERLGVAKVIFVGPSPHWTGALPNTIARRLWEHTPQRTFVGIDRDYLRNDIQLRREFKQTGTELLVSMIDFFCNKEGCLTYIGNDKKSGITTWDYGHLTPIASDLFAKEVMVGTVTAGFEKSHQNREIDHAWQGTEGRANLED